MGFSCRAGEMLRKESVPNREPDPRTGGENARIEPTPPSQGLHRLAFGVERIGLISLRFRAASLLILAVLAIGAAFGVARIKVDDSLSQLFRSNTPEVKQFEEVTARFPSREFDVLVIIEGKTLLERDSVEKLRDVVTDLQLIEGTRGIISIFSARQPPEG